MKASVVCISHLDGTGGDEIARQVAERLRFRYVDDEIVVSVARAEGLYPEAVAEAESPDAGKKLEVDFHRFEATDRLRGLIRDAVVAASEEGNVVIVAHAASYALAGRDGVLRVLVTASPESRVERLGADLVKEADRGRESYLKSFYGIDQEHSTHYDVVINTDKLPATAAVDAIAAAAG